MSMSKLSTYYGHSNYENRRAHVYALTHDNYAAQAWDGSTSFRLGEFPTEEQAEMACEDYVMGVPYD